MKNLQRLHTMKHDKIKRSYFDIDGLRLDAADVLEFEFMQMLRRVADEVKPDFYLMGEVIHGEYIRWERDARIHAVTNYHLHKALFSGHNDHNYFEIAHTVKRLYDMGGGDPLGLRLYNFADNHDVERIYSRLNNKAHFMPLHILMYTLPGIPSVYYGSEFGIEGKKGGGDDWGIRPALDLEGLLADEGRKSYYELIKALGHIRQAVPCLSYGSYEQKMLTNRQYAFLRGSGDDVAAVAVNNDDNPCWVDINVPSGRYKAMFAGEEIDVGSGNIHYELKASSGEIFVKINDGENKAELPDTELDREIKTIEVKEAVSDKSESKVMEAEQAKNNGSDDTVSVDITNQDKARKTDKPAKSDESDDVSDKDADIDKIAVPDKLYEEMTVPELQAAILQKMANNGPVTDDMKRSVSDNVWHDSLVNWVKSFR